jgi:hypothetical protein
VESALALSSEFAKITRQAPKEARRGKIFPLDPAKEDIIRKNPQLSGAIEHHRSSARRKPSKRGMTPLSQDFLFEFGVVESVAVESLEAQNAAQVSTVSSQLFETKISENRRILEMR